MTLPLIIVRGEPGASASLAAARDAGLDAQAWPLFAAAPLEWSVPEERFDALLLGSANAVRLGGAGLQALRSLPVYAVGETTAAAAREAGHAIAGIGRGGLQGLVDALPPDRPMRLLRLAGESHVALTPPSHIALATRIVYRIVASPLPEDLLAALQKPAIVALHSADAARHVRAQCDAFGIDLSRHAIVTLGERIASAAGHGWRDVQNAAAPDDAALLALAQRMCHMTR